MNILIFGQVCVDRNVSENSAYTSGGSPPLFMSKVLQQLPSTNTLIVASYGNDFLPFKGSNKFYPSQPVGDVTLQYENITKDGVRVQKAHNRERGEPVELNDEIISHIKQADILVFAPILPNIPASYYKDVMSHAKSDACKVLLPQGYFRDFNSDDVVFPKEFVEAPEILSYINTVIVSEQDHPKMMEIAKEWVSKFDIAVIVTTGEKGAVILQRNSEVNIPTDPLSPTQIINSVGAGDVFSTGVMYRYEQKRDLSEAARFANAIARQSLFCTPENLKIDYEKAIST